MNSKNTWRVLVPKRVAKTITKLPLRDSGHIQSILREFENDPWVGDIAKIRGEDNKWRRRIGNYRIFYSVYSSRRIVEIKEIERRTSSTY